MSGPNQSDGRSSVPSESASVLANLPRTRPQRSSPRRTAARSANAARASASAEGAPPRERSTRPSQETRAATTTAPARRGRPKPARSAAGKKRAATSASKRPTGASRRPARQPRAREAVPRQGFESDGDRARGPVQPPGGTELVASAVEIVGELAKSGLAAGERLVKDVFSRLSPS